MAVSLAGSSRSAIGALIIAASFAIGDARAAGGRDEQPVAPVRDHLGYGLCAKAPILPIATFYGQHTDRMGNHYHGWIPPAGPPFFVQCLNGESLVISQP